jgi:hypothetical protein
MQEKSLVSKKVEFIGLDFHQTIATMVITICDNLV